MRTAICDRKVTASAATSRSMSDANQSAKSPKLACNSAFVKRACFVLFISVAGYIFAGKLGWFMGGGSSRSDMQASVLIVPAQVRHTASLIFLHGLGDTAHGWGDLLTSFKLKNIRCVCPNAPIQPVTLNAGMKMPSWFDIKGLGLDVPEDEDGIKKASSLVKNLIEEEEKLGIPSNRIIVGGFSQGGAVALYTALTMEKTLGGVVALSCWVPLWKTISSMVKGNVANLPIFQAHGDMDPVVPLTWGIKTKEVIEKFSSKCVFNKYPNMGHSSSPKEMEDLQQFLESLFPAEK